MSKSANNGIDPLVLINKYGTDALRYTLIREVTGAGQDIRLEYDRKTDESASVEASRNFTNKLWNASRFVMMNLGGQSPAELGVPDLDHLELADRWILSRFNRVVAAVRGHLDQYGMGEAAKDLYEFIWGDFCDWYIELVKARLQTPGVSKRTAQQTLAFVLDGILKLLHPFMPHITEEVWHTLTQVGNDQFLALQPYPTPFAGLVDDPLEQRFTLLFNTVRTVRNLRAEAGIKPGQRIETILESDNPQERRILRATADYLKDLGKIDTLVIAGGDPPPAPTPSPSSFLIGTFLAPLGNLWKSLYPLLERPLDYTADFLADSHRPALTLLWLVVGLIGLRLASGVAQAVDSTPLFGDLMELVGLYYSVTLVRRHLLSDGDRQQLQRSLGAWWREVMGPEPPARRSPGSAPLPQASLPLAPERAHQGNGNGHGGNGQNHGVSAEPRQLFAGVTGTVQVLIPLTGLVDIEALRAKLTKDLTKVQGEAQALAGRLSNPGFVDKAPAAVVAGARESLAEAEAQATMLRDRLQRL
jgi:valyl-tRNA synthetase